MARLTRKNIKVFADSASNNGVFGSLQAGNPTVSNDVETLQSLTAWDYGWNSATMTSEKLPPLEEIQGVTYVTTYQQAYLMQEGMPEWAATVTYYKGSLVKKVTTTGFQIYNSLTDDNTNNQLSDTSNWKLVMDSDNLYALDNAVVHKAGAETITGIKTFEGDGVITKIKNTSVTYNNAPTGDAFTSIMYVDKNDVQMGVVECQRAPSENATIMQFNVYGANGAWASQALQLRVANNITSAYAPTPTETTEKIGKQIATTGWVNSTGNNVVHIDSDETITGLKTIRRSALQTTFLDLVNSSITNGVRPSENAHNRIYFLDSNAQPTACIFNNFESNGNNALYLQALLSETITQGTNRSLAHLGIIYPASGAPFGVAPHSDTNGSILTTYSKSKAANGYFKLGNGMIVQWGTSSTSNSSGVFTLPTAFTSTNYAVVMNSVLANVPPSQGSNANVVGWGVVQSRTTTNFTAFLCNYENSSWWRDATKTVTWIAIGY